MDAYGFLKFVHVLSAFAWVGGGLTFVVFTLVIGPNVDRQMRLMSEMAGVGLALLTPGALLTLVSGGLLVWLGAWGAEAWVAISLILALISAVNGGAVLGPRLGKVAAAEAAGDRAAALAAAQRILPFSRAEQMGNVLVIFLMVTKPGWGELWIAALAAMLLAGLGVVLVRRGRLPGAT
ncbi:DUF2269 family protein [Pseudoroseicyclus sp. CXY001]|uniref:DUF2269 family protein n=1 Tax=Pseudoroseicyclus sp. CXY001 TaxID=3242492 RepID=UPI00358DA695